MTSVIYAMLLVGFGIAFPLTNILKSQNPSMQLEGESKVLTNIFDGYYILLYLISVAFIFFINYKTVGFSENNDGTENRAESYFGSSILRNSGILFGVITIIYSCLDAYTEVLLSMNQMVALFRVLLTLYQILFIFNTRKEIIPKMRIYTKICSFGLMHIVATNVCEWIKIIIAEARDDMSNKNGTHALGVSSGNLKKDAAHFLYPFSVEYSLICALVAYEIWKKIHSTNNITVRAYEYPESPTILPKSSYALSVILVQMSATIVVVILFFYGGESKLLLGIFCLIIICVEIVILSYVMWSARKMRENVHLRDNHDERQRIKLDSTLLVTSLFGAFLLSIFNTIAQLLELNLFKSEIDENAKLTNAVGIAFEIITILEKSIQTLLILNLYWKKSGPSHMSRDIINVLLISNLSLWLLNVFINNIVNPDKSINDELSLTAWSIITHITLPSEKFYRFHTVVCYFEILKNVYSPH